MNNPDLKQIKSKAGSEKNNVGSTTLRLDVPSKKFVYNYFHLSTLVRN
jgi:hypothetical protein